MVKAKRGRIRGNNTRYTEGTEVKIIAYCKTTDEYFIQPVEGQTQCWIKSDDLEVLNESNI